MKSVPKVSIIMSVRNGENYLDEAVTSIFRQTYTDFEFIIIDDASTDKTPSILKKFKDERIKIFINKKKKGLTKSLNIGLSKARGKYIARMDHDDVARSDRLFQQVRILDKDEQIGVIGSWVKLINNQGKQLGILKFPVNHKAIIRNIFANNPLRHSTVLFRKELVQKYGFYDDKLDGAEDYDLWLRLVKHTKFANLSLPLVKYRLHHDRVSEIEEKKVLWSAVNARIKAIIRYGYSFTKIGYLLIPVVSLAMPVTLKKIILSCFRKLNNSVKKIIFEIKKNIILLIKKTENFSSLGMRLVKLTGKYPEAIHPKHLVKIAKPWFLFYIAKKDTVLDAGCNNGQNTFKLARLCKKVTGFDKDYNALQIAKRDIKRKKINNIDLLELSLGDRLPFRDNSFDKVLFLAVLEHLNNRKTAISEVSRILKPNGLLLMSVPNKNTTWKKIQKDYGLNYYSDPDHKIEYSKSDINKFLSENNFRVIKISPVSLDMPFVGLIDLFGGLSLKLYRYMTQWRKNQVLTKWQESVSFEIVAKNCKRGGI